ncbi:tRNA (uridine(54)-C5)-methyltransferase TrmA [Hydrogenovibrio sp. 3SP14C1]|uniref:tRNA (uridine(54)-C5)-methyltransferase TrmA n=1 Tax=Hydrogenovibrio sp. 3SP14C1 TaxID=3038774 RepID=UPI002416AA53|nr:tRNA (uridine(54)-C5)-methyltransferase TrmA [Hydrogenovibrio sp. 3SP14C1]MDG4813254.1 tRNA (uridine(54)-C5)-methyltransferase TrmA [Hydrogenovibrio sp. 3SP14C1]
MLCQTYPETYAEQFAEKNHRLEQLLGDLPNFEAFASDPEHYRARAEFRVWHEGDQSNYIMFDQTSKEKVIIQNCPMALESIATLMPKLMTDIEQIPVLRQKLFQVDFLATLSGEMLVTLIYRKSLQEKTDTGVEDDVAWVGAANALRDRLPITHVIGRARKQKICLDKDYVVEKLQVDDQIFTYQQIENSFTQPNAKMAQNMLHWARKMAAKANPDRQKDLIELYCGNGHFSIALSDRFHRVLATEISRTSVASAQFNMDANQVENVTVVKMAAEEISAALQGTSFFRLKDIDLKAYDFNTIFVDPPRSGLDDLTRQMVTEFEYIIYISCNPETLAVDLEAIKRTHEVMETALFDQFPYTHHIESGVFLKRKPK